MPSLIADTRMGDFVLHPRISIGRKLYKRKELCFSFFTATSKALKRRDTADLEEPFCPVLDFRLKSTSSLIKVLFRSCTLLA